MLKQFGFVMQKRKKCKKERKINKIITFSHLMSNYNLQCIIVITMPMYCFTYSLCAGISL